jgi:hypothetical protein
MAGLEVASTVAAHQVAGVRDSAVRQHRTRPERQALAS